MRKKQIILYFVRDDAKKISKVALVWVRGSGMGCPDEANDREAGFWRVEA